MPTRPTTLKTVDSVQSTSSDNEARKDSLSTLATKIAKVKTQQVAPKMLEPDPFNHFSLLDCLKRFIACIQRAIEKRRPNKQQTWHPKEGPPLVSKVCQAEDINLTSLQHHQIKNEDCTKHDCNDNQFENQQLQGGETTLSS